VAALFFQSIDLINYIHQMNVASLDLNLLKALDAFLREANVGRAALRLRLSQPAASHALRRLREALGDPLLVRNGLRMELTPRAEGLREPVKAALEQVENLFAGETFSPAQSGRHFRLLFPDLVVEILLPQIMNKIAKQAPRVSLEVMPWRGPDGMTAEFTRSLDLITSFAADAYKGFHRLTLYKDSDALAVRKGHSLGKRLSRRDVFFAAKHVAVAGRGQREDIIDFWLREKGLARDVALTVPSYVEALHIAARSDLVAFVPRRLIASLAKPLLLMLVEPPVDPGTDEQFLFYPARAQTDPGSVWLRNLVMQTARELRG
jgi:DNA-binding transcriptional LysR family regulator